MDPPKALLDRISVQASSGSDYTFGDRRDRLPDNVHVRSARRADKDSRRRSRSIATIRTGSTSPTRTASFGSATRSAAISLTWISPSTPSATRANAPQLLGRGFLRQDEAVARRVRLEHAHLQALSDERLDRLGHAWLARVDRSDRDELRQGHETAQADVDDDTAAVRVEHARVDEF